MELKITNRKGRVFTVLYDECDHEFISARTWFVTNKGYVRTNIRQPDGRFKLKSLHRLLMNIDDPKILVDHRNRKPLDNRRQNLRLANHAQNIANRAHSNSKGAYWDKKRGKWMAITSFGGERKYHGSFDKKEDAMYIYNQIVAQYHGEYAETNNLNGYTPAEAVPMPLKRHNPAGFRGVTKRPNGTYIAQIGVNYKRVHIGVYDTPEEAARAYDAEALRLLGPKAKLNFPLELAV
jgi:hypothetical protein